MSSRAASCSIHVYDLNGCRLTDHLIDGRWVTVRVEPLPR